MPDLDTNDQGPLGALEERLTGEARRMLVENSGMPRFGVLRSEFRRRRRRSQLVRFAAAASAIAAVAFLMRGRNELLERAVSRIAGINGTASDEGPETSAKASRNDSIDESMSVERSPQQGRGVLLILIAQVGENGETEYLPGWYVPEQVDVVDSADLSAAERAAAVRLLGPEVISAGEETI